MTVDKIELVCYAFTLKPLIGYDEVRTIINGTLYTFIDYFFWEKKGNNKFNNIKRECKYLTDWPN